MQELKEGKFSLTDSLFFRAGKSSISISKVCERLHVGRLVDSALLNVWEPCHRTIEVHRANEPEALSTRGTRPLCRLFARSKPRMAPCEEWIGQFSKMFD